MVLDPDNAPASSAVRVRLTGNEVEAVGNALAGLLVTEDPNPNDVLALLEHACLERVLEKLGFQVPA